MISNNLENELLNFIYTIAQDESSSNKYKTQAADIVAKLEEEVFRARIKKLFMYDIFNYECDEPFLNDKFMFIARYKDDNGAAQQKTFIEENWDRVDDILAIIQEFIQERV